MPKEEDRSKDKAAEILREMREGTAVKKHLDRQKLRIEEAVRLAIQKRDEEAYCAALIDLGVDLESPEGKEHIAKFRQLPPRR
jgi:hypothetical protein